MKSRVNKMTKKQELLAVAQNKVREGGYNNFSFRELAKDVGIKSASVHYYFPTKADLGAELAKQYSNNFMDALGDPQTLYNTGKNPISAFASLFKYSLHQDKQMCLCGLLGAETDILPELVRHEIRAFFKRSVLWLEQAYLCLQSPEAVDDETSVLQAKKSAIKTISLLEGAMMISIVHKDNSLFDHAIEELI